ncbi:hypothetical protein RQP46_010768 [Phenoliferia psychrophenolica]
MPRSLLALPTETKLHIVQLVAWQEEAFLLRKGFTTRESRKAAREVMRGSLGTVALVCKELNQIAAQFLFQTVSASRMTPLFLYRISLRHLHLVTHVEIVPDFDIRHGDRTFLYDRALHLLPSFPSFHSLTLDASAARLLFGEDWITSGQAPEPGTIESLRIEALLGVVVRVDDLELVAFTPSEAATVLSLWTDLRRLRLTGLGPELNEDVTNLGPIATELSRFQDLYDLELTGAANSEQSADAHWPKAAVADLTLYPPPLTSLKLSFDPFCFTQYSFVSAFHATLKHLAITTDYVEDEIPGIPTPKMFRVHLPFLITLHITSPGSEMSQAVTTNLLLPFLQSPITDLSISDNQAYYQSNGNIMTHLRDQLPTLQLLTLDSPASGIRMSEFRAIAAVCADRGLPQPAHSLFQQSGVLAHFLRDEVVDQGDLLAANMELKSLLGFGRRQVEWCTTLGDATRTAALVEALRPLNELRLEWKD